MKQPKPKRTAQEYALWAALPMAYTSQVEGRLKTILDKTRSRRRLTRGVIALALTLTVGMAVAVGTAQTEPRSLKEAVFSSSYSTDSSAHIEARIAFLKAQIQKFGDKDAYAGEVYYDLGFMQSAEGHYDEAVTSFDEAIALLDPKGDTHSFAQYQRVTALYGTERYGEAVTAAETLLKTNGQNPIPANLREALRGSLPGFKSMRDIKANRDAEKGHFAALTADPRWTRILANGVTVQFLGVMQSVGDRHTIWSPSGRFLSRAEYKSQGLDRTGYIDPSPNRKIILILRLQYPVGQAVITGYEIQHSVSSGYQSGFARNGTSVITDEMAFGPETSGCRVVEAWFPTAQKQTILRAGVALVSPPFGTNDPVDATKDWAEFPDITLPPMK